MAKEILKFTPCGTSHLDKMLQESIEWFNGLSEEEQQAHRGAQRAGYVRAEMAWPKSRYGVEHKNFPLALAS